MFTDDPGIETSK